MPKLSAHTKQNIHSKEPELTGRSRSLTNQKSTVNPVLFYQQNIGNQAVQHILSTGIIQPKLIIGSPNDQYEREADRVADHVMQIPDPRKELDVSSAEIKLKTNQNSAHKNVSPLIESRIESLIGSGNPLSQEKLNFFEPRFGQNLGHVSIYSGDKATELTNNLGAKAFTLGSNVVLGAGADKSVLAHELGHVIQQKNNSGEFSMLQRICQNFPLHSDPDTYCQTRPEAEARVNNANPSNCFVYRDGPPGFRWRPIPGRGGCAHYVAHQLGITIGGWHENCVDGRSVTIEQITEGRARLALNHARVGDIWTNNAEGHSAVVREIGAGVHAGEVRIQECDGAGNIPTRWINYGVVHQ